MKKFLALLSCVAPIGTALADPIVIDPTTTPGSNVMAGFTVPSDNYARIVSGSGLSLGTDGMSVGSLFVGKDSTDPVSPSGEVFVETTADPNYSIRSDGNISITSLLNVLSGYSLGIGAKTQGVTIESVNVGNINAAGALVLQNIGTFNSGSIASAANFELVANTANVTGSINSTNGNTTINVTNVLDIDGDFVTSDNVATTDISVGGLFVNDLQNQIGSMTVTSNGAITSTGSVENSGTLMKIVGTNMTVDGTMKNDSNSGNMTLNLSSLTVSGGTGTDASFVNKGNLGIVVTGETNLANGFDLSAMGTSNTFSLHTGTLVMSGGADSLSQVFENNKLANFELVVSNGAISANNISNGTTENATANMTLSAGAGGITAKTIQNRGQNLLVSTLEDTAGNITLTTPSGTSVFGAAESTTTVLADGKLTANGAVSNAGKMTLNGNEIELTSVSNTGNLTIAAQTDPTGNIHLSGGTSNSLGTTTISARQIKIDGTVLTTGGTTNIKGSDSDDGASVLVGGIQAQGGVTNLDALIHSATISGDLLVSGGAFNVGLNTYELNVNGGTQSDGNLTLSGTDATTAGNVNIANSGVSRFVLNSDDGQINIDGNVVATDANVARTASLVANIIEVGGDVTVENKGNVAFGDATSATLDVTGDVTANNGGVVEIYSGATELGSLSGSGKFIMHGNSVSAVTDIIDVSNGIWYDGTSNLTKGMIIDGTNEFTLQTTAAGKDVAVVGGVSVANGRLNITSANDVSISGNVGVDTTAGKLYVTANNGDVTFNNEISTSNGGTVVADAQTIKTAAITNSENSLISLGSTNTNTITTNALVSNAGTLNLQGSSITMTSLTSTGGATDIAASDALSVDTVITSGGTVEMSGATIDSKTMNLTGGTTKLASAAITVANDIAVSGGDMNQGGTDGVLVIENDGTVSANNLSVNGGALIVSGNEVEYTITNNATFANGINVTAGAATITAKEISTTTGAVSNAGTLTLNSTNDLSFGVINNTGTLALKSNSGVISATSLTNNNTGTTNITANTTTLTGALTASGILYQNYTAGLGTGDVNIVSPNHTLTAANITVGGINQSGTMLIKSSDVTVNGDVVAEDLRIAADPSPNWLNMDVSGSVSGGVKLVGLEHMHIGTNYTFDDNSLLHVAVLPNPGVVINSTTYNYWSTVSLADDNTFGQITNAATNAAPLISVDGRFIADVSNAGPELGGTALVSPQIGIDIFDMVDSGTAIWLLHANSGEGLGELADKIRNLNVNFCNADGTKCFKYFDTSIAANANANQTQTNLPAYLSVRDINEDGVTDSLYIVFDSRFGGPVQVFKIQPIVARVPDHTEGEYDTAGALDDLVEGGLLDAKFNNRSPIEAIPVAFAGTNFEQFANELYNRMEQYVLSPDGTALARFSRLAQPREIEVLAGDIALDEHTTFRDFEDRMFDEFIWNRNRSLRKAWLDVDYGMLFQNISDGKHASGDRFSISGGYDWQHSSTLILGLTGRVSHTKSDDADTIDLSYRPGEAVDGHTSFDVADTDIGIGAYLMKILGTKARLYGNVFADLHLLDVSRSQNFISGISGSGSAFSLISEWGLLHDWLNQYLVGNLYARVGYNFGFSVKEKAGGDEYMRLKSDGYMIFTPGYSLVAQKRIYPTSWFQIRPYASIGVEYDVLGVPDFAEFKFGPAKKYTKYDIEIDPLWANIGGGVEMLSARGFQVGLDYRYQYNNDMQLHKIKLSGSYRF